VLSGRVAGAGLLSLLALVGAAPACAQGAPAGERAEPPGADKPSWFERWLDPATAPFIPVPEIDVDPVGGVTEGLIPVWLKVDENDEIRRIIAPDIIHSQYFGWGARGRVFSYPSKDSQWTVVGGGKQRVEREFDALYVQGLARSDTWTWSLHTNFDRSGTPRFYGLGNDTRPSDQTNYVDNQGHIEANAGWNITQRWQLAYLLRMGFVQVESAVLPALPSIETRFPKLTGLDREEEFHQRLTLTYDTRDSITIPREGDYINAVAGSSNSGFWGSVSYSFLGADARFYRAIQPWLSVAAHAAVRYMTSADRAPFWALSSVGGDQAVVGERQPLRAFGQDRFVDRNSFATGVELRTRVTQFKAYSTSVSLELAPFVDLGKVFAHDGENPLVHLHHGSGVGIRGVASPFIVGFLDIGLGPEGPAIFTGINYPF
jgi:hypothetical protein